jgi:hypothetical protein
VTAESPQTILPLSAFLLRRAANPGNVWSEASAADVSLFDWAEGKLDPLAIEEQEIFDAAIPGDVVVALLRRSSRSPSWQAFIKNALNLASYGSSRESLGAAIFCAISADPDNADRAVWVVWTFGSTSRALRRSSLDPRFGLVVALNLLAAPLLSSQDGSGISPTEQRVLHICERSGTGLPLLMYSRLGIGLLAISPSMDSGWIAPATSSQLLEAAERILP